MTIGIYALMFNNYDPFYIGQSVNIAKRYKEHLYAMKRGDVNAKMLFAFKNYGLPELIIVEECLATELDSKEVYYITKFDVVSNGLNEWSGPVSVCRGELHPNAKFTNEQIKNVIKLLGDINNTFKSIASITGVSKCTIENISSGRVGAHLKDVIPNEYALMEANKGTRGSVSSSAKGRGITYPIILSPSGEEFNVENVTKFAKEHGLNMSHVCSVLNGVRKSHLGWRIK